MVKTIINYKQKKSKVGLGGFPETMTPVPVPRIPRDASPDQSRRFLFPVRLGPGSEMGGCPGTMS